MLSGIWSLVSLQQVIISTWYEAMEQLCFPESPSFLYGALTTGTPEVLALEQCGLFPG